MASGVFDDALIQHLWSTEELRAIFNDHNRVQKWFDFEAALALEQGALGIIPKAAAEEIAANAKISKVDITAVAVEIRRIKHQGLIQFVRIAIHKLHGYLLRSIMIISTSRFTAANIMRNGMIVLTAILINLILEISHVSIAMSIIEQTRTMIIPKCRITNI